MKYVTTLDLTSGFHQVPLTKELRKYSAFLYSGRSHQYCVVLFSLNVSIAKFIRALDSGLGKNLLARLTVYVDDILTTGNTL